MADLGPFQLVRVRQLLEHKHQQDGWKVNQRQPRVDDVGVIVEVLSAPGCADRYVVECVDQDGASIWLGDLAAEELEPVRRPQPLASSLETATRASRFLYVAWFCTVDLPIDDPDYEWPACILIESATADAALAWGDHLATSFSRRQPDEKFLRSEVMAEDARGDASSLPIISDGYEASDDEIGW